MFAVDVVGTVTLLGLEEAVLRGTVRVRYNGFTTEVDEIIAIAGTDQDVLVRFDSSELARGPPDDQPFLSIRGLGLELSVLGQLLRGDFSFTKFTLDPNGTPGDADDVRGLDISGTHVELALGDAVRLRDGSGTIRITREGLAGTISGQLSLDVPGVSATASFDLLLMFEVIEHLKNPQQAIEEIQRVVRPNGRILLSIPNPRTGHPYLYPELFRFGVFRRYLKSNGFAVNGVVPYGLLPPMWPLLRPLVFNRRRLAAEESAPAAGGGAEYPLTARIGRLSSNSFWTAVKPLRYAWLAVFDLTNADKLGARKLFDTVASRESHEHEARAVGAPGPSADVDHGDEVVTPPPDDGVGALVE